MCEECEKLNCKSCIDRWHKKSSDCPNCRAKYRAATKISRFTLNSLMALQFKCPKCDKTFDYKNMKQHFRQECTAIKFKKCPLSLCTAEDILGVDVLRDHLTNHCEFAKLRCTKCDMTTERALQDQHDCVASLKAKLQKQKDKLRVSESEKKLLKKDLEALRDHTIKVCT